MKLDFVTVLRWMLGLTLMASGIYAIVAFRSWTTIAAAVSLMVLGAGVLIGVDGKTR